MKRSRIENVVDAVAEALGVDTGTCSEAQFKAAVDAVEKAMQPGRIRWPSGLEETGYLSVHPEGLRVHLFRGTDYEKKISTATVHTREQLIAWCKKWNAENFMCSSSVDFPEDSTNDKRVIALCQEIRSE